MRTVSRLLASVKPARFLEPGNPTGLTGLFTHDAPRSTLLFLYGLTLDKLKAIPEHSVYRQSAERIIKHRMKIVESIKAKGYDEWAQRAEKMFEEHPHIFNSTASGPRRLVSHGRPTFITAQHEVEEDEQDAEWDGEEEQRNQGEDEDQPLQWVDGKDGVEYKDGQKVLVGTSNPQPAEEKATENVPGQVGRSLNPQSINWEPEPQLEASQIEEMENQIGAGLIEEVIQVAEGELKLVNVMIESKVWEELEETPPGGQWEYFTLDRHMPLTPESPK